MNNELKVLFYLHKSRKTTTGDCPVMGRLTIGSSEAQFSCKMTAPLKLWVSGRAVGKNAEATAINQKLDRIKYLIADSYKELSAVSDRVTARQVKTRFQGIATGRMGLVRYFEEYIEEFSKRVGVNREPSTLKTYQHALWSLKLFLKNKYRISEIAFSSLNIAFIEAYDLFLKVERKMKPATIISYTIKLRRMVKLAQSEGLLMSDPFIGYSAEQAESGQKYLTGEELKKIRTVSLSDPFRYLVRDMFIFSCFTGFAYGEMCNLRLEELIEEGGLLWIKTRRRKTGTPEDVPLLDLPIALIRKYRHLAPPGKLLPMLSNSNMNIHLKKIAVACGIGKNLTFHTARHTYATEILLSQGVSIESVSRMLGHRDLRSTRVYAKITHEKIGADMDKLQARIEGEFNGMEFCHGS